MDIELFLFIANLILMIFGLIMRYWNKVVVAGCLVFIFANVARNFGFGLHFLTISILLLVVGIALGFKESRSKEE
jgi:hypothetical protein